jgi:hypothetical protein
MIDQNRWQLPDVNLLFCPLLVPASRAISLVLIVQDFLLSELQDALLKIRLPQDIVGDGNRQVHESVEFYAHILALEAGQSGLKLVLEEINNQRPIILQMLLPRLIGNQLLLFLCELLRIRWAIINPI